jgi:murein DD-endopeptidase MepM/ murein hydrolase activator NlpD
MAEPKIELHPEPMQGDTVTFQLLAPPTRGGEAKAQISVLLRIRNLEPTEVVLKSVGIKVHFSDNSTPFETANPVNIHIPAGGHAFWNNRVFLSKAVDTGLPEDVFVNQNIVTSALANIVQFKLTFKSYTDTVKKMYALRPHASPSPEHAFAFPAKWTDLRWDECWNSAAAVHGESEYGSQLFALDLGNMGWDSGSSSWSQVLPGTSGAKNEDYRIWGKPVYAMADGEVVRVRWDFPDNEAPGPISASIQALMKKVGDGGGNFITIATGDEIHGYNHFRKDSIPAGLRSQGKQIKKGDLLGYAGNSGNSSNPHLHIGVLKKPRLVVKGDPKYILRPMPFTDVHTINSANASGIRRQDPWFKNTAHGLSVAGAWPNTCLIWPSKRDPGGARLFLKEFRCVEETDMEPGGESPYFVVFLGKRIGNTVQSRLVRIRKQIWDTQVDAGELWRADEEVIEQVDKETFVLVALMEEDFDADIAGDTVSYLRSEMRKAFKDVASDASLSFDDLEIRMKPLFLGAIGRSTTNDECLGVKRLDITTHDGELPLLNYAGDGSNYRVRFETK